MAIEFYCGSGSPYAWRVWLALEHKALAYELKMLSFSAGDLKKPEYLALNPRGRVPLLVDDGFAVYESAAIVEYLADAYATSGRGLLPATPRSRARVRRLIREADEYVAHPLEAMVEQILFKPPTEWDDSAITKARDAFVTELAHFERELEGDFLAGAVGAADFTLYPLIALTLRMEIKKPRLGVREAIGPRLGEWMRRVEALPYYATTYPPHWNAG